MHSPLPCPMGSGDVPPPAAGGFRKATTTLHWVHSPRGSQIGGASPGGEGRRADDRTRRRRRTSRTICLIAGRLRRCPEGPRGLDSRGATPHRCTERYARRHERPFPGLCRLELALFGASWPRAPHVHPRSCERGGRTRHDPILSLQAKTARDRRRVRSLSLNQVRLSHF